MVKDAVAVWARAGAASQRVGWRHRRAAASQGGNAIHGPISIISDGCCIGRLRWKITAASLSDIESACDHRIKSTVSLNVINLTDSQVAYIGQLFAICYLRMIANFPRFLTFLNFGLLNQLCGSVLDGC